ncbi:uncharacterized protein LOC125674769 isoform X2 [Ostrea edulis]|uniref:uncharacterized protein LOC125674769 isoform X2 n=1 Tax=Ostrea edulis TaxID=37623 RepID=UPI0020944EA3|nr:uncharacterized protein LOC125674769 isoform X2 [Ostrea edulis]
MYSSHFNDDIICTAKIDGKGDMNQIDKNPYNAIITAIRFIHSFLVVPANSKVWFCREVLKLSVDTLSQEVAEIGGDNFVGCEFTDTHVYTCYTIYHVVVSTRKFLLCRK